MPQIFAECCLSECSGQRTFCVVCEASFPAPVCSRVGVVCSFSYFSNGNHRHRVSASQNCVRSRFWLWTIDIQRAPARFSVSHRVRRSAMSRASGSSASDFVGFSCISDRSTPTKSRSAVWSDDDEPPELGGVRCVLCTVSGPAQNMKNFQGKFLHYPVCFNNVRSARRCFQKQSLELAEEIDGFLHADEKNGVSASRPSSATAENARTTHSAARKSSRSARRSSIFKPKASKVSACGRTSAST